MYYTPGHFLQKSATGCLVHHYSYPSAQFDGNYTLDQFVENNTLDQFVENNTLDQFVENNTLDQFDGNYTLEQFVSMGVPAQFSFLWGYQSIFTYTGFILCFHMGV